MRLLFDTHVFVWWFAGDLRIPEHLRDVVSTPDTLVHVSAATAWELATKHRLGKLPEAGPLVDGFFDFIDRCNFVRLPITVEDLDLVTADPALAALGLA